MMYKWIQNIGLLIFLFGFGTWLLSFGIERYEVSNDVLDQSFSEKSLSEFTQHSHGILQTGYPNAFKLVSDLISVFDAVNQQKLSDYSISSQKLASIAKNANRHNFSYESIENEFDSTSEVAQYQYNTLKSWGGGLEGRSFESPEQLKNELTRVNSNIKKWAIINDKGYSSYAIKDLNYEIVKNASVGVVSNHPLWFLMICYGLSILGAVMYILPKKLTEGPAGIKNDGIFKSALKNKGWLGMVVGAFLILFYILLYFFPEYMTSWIIMVDPISLFLKGDEASRFFLYGFIYTLTILVMGVRMLIKYRHSRYQIYRTFSVMFFQLAFAFLIPEILMRLNQPYFDFKNIWPLDYDFFFDYELDGLIASGSLGVFMLGWGIGLTLIGVPVMVYFFGKRWYCSWVCGCGGLAETLGDPFRQLSDKSLKAWKIERYSIHGVLVFAIVMTAAVLYTYWSGNDNIMGINTYSVRSIYGSWIGAGFAGVVGTGFYPIMGNRVWCRFGCPLAAYLGLVQRFKSRFRITTNGGQCISCGNCSTHCEMGIDVRWYAQRGQNIIRSSCVGCGVCSAVCPRGVLNLENRADDNRFESAGLIGNNSFPEIKKP